MIIMVANVRKRKPATSTVGPPRTPEVGVGRGVTVISGIHWVTLLVFAVTLVVTVISVGRTVINDGIIYVQLETVLLDPRHDSPTLSLGRFSHLIWSGHEKPKWRITGSQQFRTRSQIDRHGRPCSATFGWHIGTYKEHAKNLRSGEQFVVITGQNWLTWCFASSCVWLNMFDVEVKL